MGAQVIRVRLEAGRGGSVVLKSIAVMTSGGDSPGMNAAARAVARTALYEGVHVWGINDGYHGLLEEDMRELQSMDVGDIIQRGGTFLGTARCKRWQTPEGRRLGHENLVKRGIEGLCVIGGDGSLRGAQLLSEEYGFPIIGLPGTIDIKGLLEEMAELAEQGVHFENLRISLRAHLVMPYHKVLY